MCVCVCVRLDEMGVRLCVFVFGCEVCDNVFFCVCVWMCVCGCVCVCLCVRVCQCDSV